MKGNIILVALSALPLLSTAQTKQFNISGTMVADTAANAKMYLAYNDNGTEMRDSSAIVNNSYHFKGNMHDGAIRVNLHWEDRTRKPSYKGFLQFYAGPGKVTVVSKTRFNDVVITGSPVQEESRQLEKDLRDTTRTDKEVMIAFIKSHPNSWLSFVNLEAMMIRWRNITLDEADELYAGLSPALRKYSNVQDIKVMVDARRKAVVGNQAIEFSALDPNGRSVALSSYRGKYVFIDFWASWCHPCREENPFVTAAYQRFKNKGFNVLGVSLDATREPWLKAVAQDNLAWTQVSNLKGFKDDVAVKYGIHAIPANFLIDPKGMIVAMNLRGEDLEKKLAEIFK